MRTYNDSVQCFYVTMVSLSIANYKMFSDPLHGMTVLTSPCFRLLMPAHFNLNQFVWAIYILSCVIFLCSLSLFSGTWVLNSFPSRCHSCFRTNCLFQSLFFTLSLTTWARETLAGKRLALEIIFLTNKICFRLHFYCSLIYSMVSKKWGQYGCSGLLSLPSFSVDAERSTIFCLPISNDGWLKNALKPLAHHYKHNIGRRPIAQSLHRDWHKTICR